MTLYILVATKHADTTSAQVVNSRNSGLHIVSTIPPVNLVDSFSIEVNRPKMGATNQIALT
ncbi:MAG: hypothetical protein SWH78_18030 [Thermodesulfobacteriota bacterium]|nr:hypothetical protein [Thermodesulfobacteriota bacterium]